MASEIEIANLLQSIQDLHQETVEVKNSNNAIKNSVATIASSMASFLMSNTSNNPSADPSIVETGLTQVFEPVIELMSLVEKNTKETVEAIKALTEISMPAGGSIQTLYSDRDAQLRALEDIKKSLSIKEPKQETNLTPVQERVKEPKSEGWLAELATLLLGGGLLAVLGSLFGPQLLKLLEDLGFKSLADDIRAVFKPLEGLSGYIETWGKYAAIMGEKMLSWGAGMVGAGGKVVANTYNKLTGRSQKIPKAVPRRELLKKAADKGLKGPAAKAFVRAEEKAATKAAASAATKAGSKGLLKRVLGKIPIVGTLITLYEAYDAFSKDDYKGGFLKIASGLATLIPFVGIGVAFVIDMFDAAMTEEAGGDVTKKQNIDMRKFGAKWLQGMMNKMGLPAWVTDPLIKFIRGEEDSSSTTSQSSDQYLSQAYSGLGSVPSFEKMKQDQKEKTEAEKDKELINKPTATKNLLMMDSNFLKDQDLSPTQRAAFEKENQERQEAQKREKEREEKASKQKQIDDAMKKEYEDAMQQKQPINNNQINNQQINIKNLQGNNINSSRNEIHRSISSARPGTTLG
jgi:hypothetical protein